jgi:hypothetical protein
MEAEFFFGRYRAHLRIRPPTDVFSHSVADPEPGPQGPKPWAKAGPQKLTFSSVSGSYFGNSLRRLENRSVLKRKITLNFRCAGPPTVIYINLKVTYRIFKARDGPDLKLFERSRNI